VEVLSKETSGVIDDDRHARLTQHMYVYRQTDLDSLYEGMKEFWWAIFYFNGYLRRPADQGRIEEVAKLRTFPQVRSALKFLTKAPRADGRKVKSDA
jgi:hypothetical protein